MNNTLLQKAEAVAMHGYLPPTRVAAKANGALLFFTGEPCPNGHYSPRYASSGLCLACVEDRRKNERLARKLAKEALRQKNLNRLAATESVEVLSTLEGRYTKEGASPALVTVALSISGFEQVAPGLLVGDVKGVPGWLQRAMDHLATSKHLFLSGSGLCYFPSIVQEHLPSTKSVAVAWRDAFQRTTACDLLSAANEDITNALASRAKQSVRAKGIWQAWTGEASSSEAAQ